jgi:hypothetical protein
MSKLTNISFTVGNISTYKCDHLEDPLYRINMSLINRQQTFEPSIEEKRREEEEMLRASNIKLIKRPKVINPEWQAMSSNYK